MSFHVSNAQLAQKDRSVWRSQIGRILSVDIMFLNILGFSYSFTYSSKVEELASIFTKFERKTLLLLLFVLIVLHASIE